MVMGSKKHTATRKSVSLVADGHIIKPSMTEKLLGGQLHQSLTWNFHLRDHDGLMMKQLTSRINGLKRVLLQRQLWDKVESSKWSGYEQADLLDNTPGSSTGIPVECTPSAATNSSQGSLLVCKLGLEQEEVAGQSWLVFC